MKKYLYISIPIIIIAIFCISKFLLPSERGGREGFNNGDLSAEAASAPRTGLVGWWTMDVNDMSSTGATIYDKSGFKNNGTITGTTTSTGKIGQARSFNGTSNQISLTTTGLPTGTLGAMTVSLWAKPSAALGNLYVFEYGICSANNQWAIIGGAANWMWSNCTTGDINSTTTPKIGRWDSITTVYDGTKKYLYVNGVLENAITYSSFNITDTAIQFGTYHGSNYYPGAIDDVRIYNRALSAQEVSQLYNSAKTSFTQSPQRASSTPASGGKLVGWWTMDTNDISSTGATLYDKSGLGNNGTVTGTTTSTGKIGQARSFNGTSDYVNVTSLTPNIATNGTASISGWYKFDQTASQKGSSMGLHSQIYQHTANNYFYLTNGADFFNVASVIRAGVWYHIVLTYNGNHSTVALYIDGVRYNVTLQTTSDTSAMSSFVIGSSTTFFDGSIDDVRIYDYTLSAQEVANLYTASAKKYTAAAPREGLIGWWTMDVNDIDGTVVYDKSGQNKNVGISGTSSISGKIKEARFFDGVNDCTSVNSFYNTNGQSYSLSAWVKTASSTPVKNVAIMSISDGGSWAILPNGGFYQDVGARTVTASHYTGAAYKSVNSIVSLPLNKWAYIAVTYNSSSQVMSFYVDGINRQDATSVAPPGQSYSNLQIGCTANNHTNIYQYFDGSLDDVRVYNRALSAAEVAGLYESAKKNYVQ